MKLPNKMFEILTKNSTLTGLQNNSIFTLLNYRQSFASKHLDRVDQKTNNSPPKKQHRMHVIGIKVKEFTKLILPLYLYIKKIYFKKLNL